MSTYDQPKASLEAFDTLSRVRQHIGDKKIAPLQLRQILDASIRGQESAPATTDPDSVAIMRSLIAKLDDGIENNLDASEIRLRVLETLDELDRHYAPKPDAEMS
ncbi:hypothetical protein HY620_03200 [Candidatus Uhrbacteria bacterium]|nr:hypothetical protein [Candidatus Uhrbacteria bacterium]